MFSEAPFYTLNTPSRPPLKSAVLVTLAYACVNVSVCVRACACVRRPGGVRAEHGGRHPGPDLPSLLRQRQHPADIGSGSAAVQQQRWVTPGDRRPVETLPAAPPSGVAIDLLVFISRLQFCLPWK